MLKYEDKLFDMEGIIVELHDGSVSIDLKERLGSLKIPRRMLFCDFELKVGQKIGFKMSYPEQLEEEPISRYVSSIQKNNENQAKMQQKLKEKKDEY